MIKLLVGLLLFNASNGFAKSTLSKKQVAAIVTLSQRNLNATLANYKPRPYTTKFPGGLHTDGGRFVETRSLSTNKLTITAKRGCRDEIHSHSCIGSKHH